MGKAVRANRPLLVVAIALSAGIVADRFGGFGCDHVLLSPFAAWSMLATVCLAAWWLLWRSGRPAAAACLLLAAVGFSGAAWHQLWWNLFSQQEVGRFAHLEPLPACAMATVVAAPEILPAPPFTPLRAIPAGERSRVELRVTGLRDGTRWLPADGRCQLLVDGHLLGVHVGDRLQIFAQLRRPAAPLNPGQFDFAAHARADRRLAVLHAISPDCVTIERPASDWSIGRSLERFRGENHRVLREHLGADRVPLAAAILLGDRAGLPTESIEPFFLTGTIHLLVVSGLHVGILALGLYGALRLGWLPRRSALVVVRGVVAAYAVVTGAQPPVVRAAVLVILLCVAAWTGQRGFAFNSLAAAALVVLAVNPSELFQTGTQLSFLCVAVLIGVGESSLSRQRLRQDALEPLIEASRPWYARASRRFAVWNGWMFVITAAIWLAALPLVLYRFHVFTPIAVVISPLVWVATLLILWGGFLTLFAGWLLPPLALPFATICSAALTLLETVVHWTESVPAGHRWLPGPALWWVIGFYVALLAVLLWGRTPLAPRRQVALLCVWIVAGLAPPLLRAWNRSDELRCGFVAVGHGTCVVLEMPTGETLLFDAGSLGSPDYATQTIAGYLWHRGIMRIDAIVLSHADVDHFDAVPGLLERFRVGTVYVSPVMFDWFGASGPRGALAALRHAIDEAGVPIRELWAGDRLRVGRSDSDRGNDEDNRRVTIEVLHPPRQGVIANDNANSITLAIEYAGRRILLPGDLESPGLDDLIAELPYDCDVLMAPHHGSRRSDPPGFAAWSTPEWVVISGGTAVDVDVRRTYESADARVFSTGEVGAVVLRLRPNEIRVATHDRTATAILPPHSSLAE